jgi:hypothetical protein
MILLAFTIASFVELYFFLAQRAALEICRREGIEPRSGRHMLPLWYAAVWPVKLAKFIALYFVFEQYGVLAAIGCLGASLALTSLFPVPHRHFRPMFERRVSQLVSESPELGAKLMVALLSDS